MHFICSTFGSAGDVFPMLGLAVELHRRGHDITFATNAHFADMVIQSGLAFEPLGDESDFEACISNPDLWHPKKSFRHVFDSLRPFLRRQYEIHAERAGRGDTVGITNCFGFGAFMAQDKLNLPVITLHLQPAVLWSSRLPPALPGLFGPRWLKTVQYWIGERFFLDPVVCPFLNEWRRELEVPPIRRIAHWWHSRYGVLCLFPDWFAPPQADWPSPLMQTDFPLWNYRGNEEMSAEVGRFLGRGEPPIVFTPGSANVHGADFFRAAVQACSHLGRRGVLLTKYRDQLPRSLPDSIAHFDYVPLDQLLPAAAAFVHHGGIGSTSQALLAGIPQVLMPLAHDQFDNADRIQRLGVGASVPVHRFTGKRLSQVLQPLLTSPQVAADCRRLADRLSDRSGLRQSADAVEQRVASG